MMSEIRELSDPTTLHRDPVMGEADFRARLEDLSQQASEKERALWRGVKNRHPGQADHDPVAWKEWLDAASELRSLADKLRELRGK